MMSRSLFCAAIFVAATSSMAIEEPEVHFPAPPPPGPPCGFPPPPPPPPPPPHGPPFVAEAVTTDDCAANDLADGGYVKQVYATNVVTGTAVPLATGSLLCEEARLLKRAEFAYRAGPSGSAASGYVQAIATPSGTAVRMGTAAPAGTAVQRLTGGTAPAVAKAAATGHAPSGTAISFATGTSGVVHKDHAAIDHVSNGDTYLNRRALFDGNGCGTGTGTAVLAAAATETFVPKEPCGCPTYAKLLGRACPHAVTTGTAIERVVQPVAVTETAFVATGTAGAREACGCPSYGTLLARQCPHAATAVTAVGTATPVYAAGAATASLVGVYKAYDTVVPVAPAVTAASNGCGCSEARILARQCHHEVPGIVGTGTGYATGAVYSASTTFGGAFTGTGTVSPATGVYVSPVATVIPAPPVEKLVDVHPAAAGCPSEDLQLVKRACPTGTGGLLADPPAATGTVVSGHRAQVAAATGTGGLPADPPAATGTAYAIASGGSCPFSNARKAPAPVTGVSYATGTAGLKAQIADPYPSGELVGSLIPTGTTALSIVQGPTAIAAAAAADGPCHGNSLYRRADDDAPSDDSSEKDVDQDATDDAESGAGRLSGGLFGVAAAIAATVALL